MKIAIYGQQIQPNTARILEKVFTTLAPYTSEISIEKNYFELLIAQNPVYCAYKTFSNASDLNPNTTVLISIGGDGTILRAATFVKDKNIPILGINAGRLGFLATIPEENIETWLPKIYTKEYKISSRSLLELSTDAPEQPHQNINFALNEISVTRKDTTSMITIDTYLDGEYLTSYWADGLIVATPTGSTGYSLSCGGPVLTPEVNSLVITPIAPHNLNARPLVIPDTTDVMLKVSGREDNYWVSLDARMASVNNQTTLHIKKAPFQIQLIEFIEEDFLKTIRKKLLWGEDKRNS
jgi:NAD+ kinase